MSATLTPLPVELIRAAFDADRRGAPALPPGRRPEAEAWLRRALVDFDALQAHVAVLSEWYATPLRLPRPRRDRWDGAAALPDAPPAGFPHATPLEDGRVVAVADGGLATLDDAELARLVLNPYALFDLYDAIDELVPEQWTAAMHEASEPRAAVPTAPPGRPAGRGGPWAVAVSLAAGVLLGGLGLWGFGRVGAGADVATLAFRPGVTRGAEEPPLVADVGSRFDGFATVVLLTPGRRPLVSPGLGAGPLAVGPGKPASTAVLPRSPGARAVVVVTETPSQDAVRDAADEWAKAHPDAADAAALEAFLRLRLGEYHYRRVATAVADFAPAP